MKARLPASARITRRQAEANAELQEQRMQNETRRLCKMFAYALNREFGFGKSRIDRTLTTLVELMNEAGTDDLFWEHLDHVVIDELKIEFTREVVDTDGCSVNILRRR